MFLGISAKYLTVEEKDRLKERIRAMVDLVREIAEEEYAKGEEKGIEKGRLDVARAMLADGMELERIARLTRLPMDEQEALRREMAK